MAEDGRPAIFVIEEIVHEHMDYSSERINREISDILGEREDGEGDTQR